ncbi:MAG: VCBS repeat-containing protein [Anaerolineae bacterium]|nr:VCBS repeat-containing protein [Anaerolineae bacterium]
MMKYFKQLLLTSILVILPATFFFLILETILAAPPARQLLVPANPVTDPAGNTHAAPVTSTVSITYDEAINAATVSTQTFAVHAMQTGLLAQTYSVSSGTISLKSILPFKPGELVQVSATTGTLSLVDGSGPVSPTVWQFRAAVQSSSAVFTQSTQYFDRSPHVALGDVDGDGDLDAFVETNRVWLNNGSGHFTDSGQTLEGETVALGDLDSDGDLDAFVGNPDKVFVNDGKGVFTDSGQDLGTGRSAVIALGDVDGDGDLDAFIANGGVGLPNTLWLNNGDGIFSDSGQNLSGDPPYSPSYTAALGDLDGDGDLDVFVGNTSLGVGLPNSDRVWLNDGRGHFTDSGQGLGNFDTEAAALGDLDGDGDLDAFTASGNDLANMVWLNDGSGTFNDSGQRLGSNWGGAVALGDLDGDGDLDAVVLNYFGDSYNEVWLNNGSGIFSNSEQNLGRSAFSDLRNALALGDMDVDGDLDALVSNEIWLNRNSVELSVTKTVTPSAAAPDQTITYTIKLANNGTQTLARDVVMTDTLPGMIGFNGYVQQSSAQLPVSGTITWGPHDILTNTSYTIIFTASVSSQALDGQMITNTAWLSSSNAGSTLDNASFIVAINDPPNAVDDSAMTVEGNSVPIDVLANDTDPDEDTLFISMVEPPTYGNATTDGSSITYTPTTGFTGTAVFTYIASDGALTDLAVVTVVVTPAQNVEAAVYLVRDFEDSPAYLTHIDETLFFVVQDGLWKSDGTSQGTVLVKGDISVDSGSAANVNGTMFFSADDGIHGVELWKSDGTTAGTVLVKDINPSDGSFPRFFVSMNNMLFFVARGGVTGAELWKSDGTLAGTVMVKDIYPGAQDPPIGKLVNAGDTLFFSANDGINGAELWKSDGTALGTVMVKDIYPGNGLTPHDLTDVNGMLFFVAYDENGEELWKSDGTLTGTVMVKDIYPGPVHSEGGSSSPSRLINVDGTLFFIAHDENKTTDLWKSDGTLSGTLKVKVINPNTYSFNSPNFLSATDVDGTLFFRADDGTNGLELWKSDGTTLGTIMVKDINPGPGSSHFSTLSSADRPFPYLTNTLFFGATEGTPNFELWKSDGTSTGTVMIRNINIDILTNAGDKVFFRTYDEELWALFLVKGKVYLPVILK